MRTLGMLVLVSLGSLGCSPATPPATSVQALPTLLVHKSPTCGCCEGWVNHMRQAGFPVEVRENSDLNEVKTRVGVPFGMGSCHTTEVAGYFIEGHVPAGDVKRVLAERPAGKGLVLPGMPLGSPGMEVDDRLDPYEVLLVQADGGMSVFSRHGQ